MDEKFLKPYNAQETEARIYHLWEKSGYFNPDNLPGTRKETFTIIMPPPNANGDLHVGHAMMLAVEDLMIRYMRMRGYKTLWLPGADHAGFETQVVYEKELEKAGRSRFKMPRKKLYDEIMEFTLSNKKNMEDQIRKLGASCDWSRERFTLDEDIVKTVYGTFEKLYEDKLVYRGERPVNWCVKHQTSLSQLETEDKVRKDPLYYVKYGPLTLATARPETKFGDTAIAVNPHDSRYADYIGKEIEIDTLIGKAKLKVIADEYVDPEFGTGVVKITPAHDPNDFEVGKRHNLEAREVIDQFGRLNERTGQYAGMKIREAREQIAADMEKAGLLEKVDPDYEHTVLTCYKCGSVLEPRVMPQWFVKIQPLAERAKETVTRGDTSFVTKKFEKIFFHWMANAYDWNISRQIAWGIPIPAWYKDGEVHIGPEAPGEGWEQDPDTFDTWFSSGQWPFAALGYPNQDDFKTYYPSSVMETGADILFFWVSKMLMLSLYRTGTVPFETIYLHGMVRDAKGQKMSKSKGNVINPLEITDKYGTDALRMGLIVGNTPGTDLALSEDKIKGYKHFSNKIWNIARFVLSHIEGTHFSEKPALTSADTKLVEELEAVSTGVTADMNAYRFHLAAEKLYHYVWDRFAAEILEESKSIVTDGSADEVRSRQWMLYHTTQTILKLLHPFMPFITEEIWSHLPQKDTDLLMVSAWPAKTQP